MTEDIPKADPVLKTILNQHNAGKAQCVVVCLSRLLPEYLPEGEGYDV